MATKTPIETLRAVAKNRHHMVGHTTIRLKDCPLSLCVDARAALEDVEVLVREFAEVCQVAHQRQRNSMFQRHESDSWMDCPDDKCPKRRTALTKFQGQP